MKRNRVLWAGLLVLPLLFAAGQVLAGDLEAIDPYARSTPPGMENSAAYLTLRNSGDADRRLVAAESPVAATLELHTHLHEDGMMRMRQVEHIDVPAGAEVKLEPGGLHVMLLGLQQPLTPGESIPLSLRFADGEQLELEAEVRHPSRQHHQRHHH